MRVVNSLKNSIYGIASQLVIIFLGFFTRSIFLRYLGNEYLGLNGLFSNVISILSLTELGFGTAALYALYKPLANKDEEGTAALMNLYAKIYHVMFLVVVVIGLVIMPFIPFLIEGEIPSDINIYAIYLLFVANSAITYLFAYKRSLLFADQKNYKITNVSMICKVTLALVQIAILYITGNYYLFLIAMITFGFLENLILSLIVDKNYPYLKTYKKSKASKEVKQELIVKTKALMMHKVGSIVVFSTENLITSAYVGLGAVGIYSNYTLITNQLHTFISSITDGMKASLGNFNASESDENKLMLFKKINLLIYLIYSFCTVCLYNLLNPFIPLWLGEEGEILSMSIVFLICFDFFLRGMRSAYNLAKDTAGVYEPDRFKPILEAGLYLILGITLVQVMGFKGVLLAKVINTLMIPYIIEVHVTFKYVFHKKAWDYYKIFFKNLIVLAIAMTSTISIVNMVEGGGFLAFVMKLFICLIVPNVINFIVYGESEEFQYLLGIFKNIFSGMLGKFKKTKTKEQIS